MTRLSICLRTALLGSIFLLSACGGGGSNTGPNAPAPTPTFSIGGGITSLGNASGLILINNGSEKLPIPANATAFTFVNQLATNATYNVTIGQQPPDLTCTISNATGTVQQAAILSIAVSCTQPANTVRTFAGDDGVVTGPGSGASLRLGQVSGIALDTEGNTYVTDTSSNIRKISPSGVVTNWASGYTPSGQSLFSLHGLAVDNSGNVYVADSLGYSVGNAIRKISPSGAVATLAGGNGYGIADGSGTAQFNAPTGVALDNSGNVYVADSGNNSIRKITPSGVVSTLAGCGHSGFVDGTGNAACFNNPTALTIDGVGNVYVADTNNHALRKLTPAGLVTTLVGQGPNSTGYVDGVASVARFGALVGVVLDSTGNLYVVDRDNNAVRKITPGVVVSTLAGGTSGYADGMGTGARFANPNGIAIDGVGNLRIADGDNRAVRQVTPAGVVTTLAGQGPVTGLIDGTGTAARFNAPTGITTDGAGTMYVADSLNFAIRKITPVGVVTTLAGGGIAGNVDAVGAAARFMLPTSIAADNAGALYVVDVNTIRKISPAGVVTTVIQIDGLQGVAVDGAGTLYMTSNNEVLKLPLGGGLTTLAGNSSAGFVDGLGSAASFNAPKGLAVDSGANVYVVDSKNNAIRKISPQGQVTTLANVPQPLGVTLDSLGNVYATGNKDNFTIYTISSSGIPVRIAGGYFFGGNGYNNYPPLSAAFNLPTGITVDGAGGVYVADTNNNAIRKIVR